jgi:hypothetical protein
MRPVVLISLHACGPLSTNMLRLYADWQEAELVVSSSIPLASADALGMTLPVRDGPTSCPAAFQHHPCIACVNVGCCYTYLEGGAADGFPFSQLGRDIMSRCPSGIQGRPERRRSMSRCEAPDLTDAAKKQDCLMLTRNMAMAACQAPWRWFSDDHMTASGGGGGSRPQSAAITTGRVTLHEDISATFSSLYLRALLQRFLCHILGVDDLDVIGRVPAPQAAAPGGPQVDTLPRKGGHNKKKRQRGAMEEQQGGTIKPEAAAAATVPPPPSDRALDASGGSPPPKKEEDVFVAYAITTIEKVRARCRSRGVVLRRAGDHDADHSTDTEVILSDVVALRNMYRESRQRGEKEQLACLWTIKALVGHGIEGVVLEDRVQYLIERLVGTPASSSSSQRSSVANSQRRFFVRMEPVFDPRESPRSQAIVTRWLE